MEPTRQVVRHTTAIGASGSPAVLAEMVTSLGYRWHPEYTVYEEYQDFNQGVWKGDSYRQSALIPTCEVPDSIVH